MNRFVLKLLISLIYLQTLFFKFTAASESVYIFETMGMEPWGRWLAGIAELVISITIWIPALSIPATILSLGVIGGAILSHLTILGIEVMGDGGFLFILALIVFSSSLALLYLEKDRMADFFHGDHDDSGNE